MLTPIQGELFRSSLIPTRVIENFAISTEVYNDVDNKLHVDIEYNILPRMYFLKQYVILHLLEKKFKRW